MDERAVVGVPIAEVRGWSLPPGFRSHPAPRGSPAGTKAGPYTQQLQRCRCLASILSVAGRCRLLVRQREALDELSRDLIALLRTPAWPPSRPPFDLAVLQEITETLDRGLDNLASGARIDGQLGQLDALRRELTAGSRGAWR